MDKPKIKQKAKAYNEALERAKQLLNTSVAYDRFTIESIFPELKESYNERVRKAIIEFFELQDDNTTYSFIPKKDILAWLEKQGKTRKITHEEICKSYGIPDIGEFSDGYHTFNGLYKQRMILFAVLVKTYKDRAWKSWKHEDGLNCFGGGWFIVGIDTPAGTYTYHYEAKDWDRFDCKILDKAKHWDGHDESDIERLFSLLEKQGEQKPLYIRFGNIPANGKSKIYCGEEDVGCENGVSVYPAFRDADGRIVLGLSLPITKTTLYTQQHLLEYDNRPCFLVSGDYIGRGSDGEPLISNVNVIEEIEQYRVKESKQVEQKETLCDKCRKEQPSDSCQDITALGRCALEHQGKQKLQSKSTLEVWKDMRLEVYAQASGNRHEPNCSDDKTKMFSLSDIDEIIEKISEQKPVEWHREDEQNLNACLGFIPDEYLRRWLKDVIHIKYDKPIDKVEQEYHCNGVREPKKATGVLKQLLNEQETTWSDMDLIDLGYLAYFVNQNGDKFYGKNKPNVVKWIYSFPNRTIPQQEWSEEDKVKINRIVAFLEKLNLEYLNVAGNDILLKDIEWLKSIKERYSWKPSEENNVDKS